MFRISKNINVFLLTAFLINAILPSNLFSYETKSLSGDRNWIDESLDYKPAVYKKVKCPNCSMEFFYVPGKESPYAQWVHYEVYEEKTSDKIYFEDKKRDKDTKDIGKKETLSMLKEKIGNGIKIEDIEDLILEAKIAKKDLSAMQIKKIGRNFFELRQKLTCPYDGHSFFAEGDILQDVKLLEESLNLSIIERSFSQSIPLGISKKLRLFGYDLFKRSKEFEEQKEQDKSSEFAEGALAGLGLLKAAFTPVSQPTFSSQTSSGETAVIPIDPDYILGPGDMLVINIWGSVQESFPVEVDREGKIMLPKAGPFYIWGLKFRTAEDRIREKLNQFYTNFSLDLSMGKLRNVQIYVMGHVNKPGSYIISSQSTVFQALYEALGPTKLGSFRKIKLIHAEGTEEQIDLYPFLLEGAKVDHAKLRSGDTIFVPAIGDVVGIAGNVKNPAIYEMNSKMLLVDLLNFAGGITPTGDLQQIQVERIKNNERRILVDLKLQSTDIKKHLLGDILLQNGDLVIVSPIGRLKHNFVSIIGNVERPGDYAREEMTVSDLIKKAKGFLPGTYLYRAEIARVTKTGTRRIIPLNLKKMMMGKNDEDIALKEWDILLIYSESDVTRPSFVEIDGAVNRPGKYELTPGMKVSDLVFRGGGIEPDSAIRGAELYHIIPGEQPAIRNIGIKRLSRINISIDKDIILRAGDVLFVKSEPRLTEKRSIVVKGEVKYPGTYTIREGERISSIIERAGGFTKVAFIPGIVFTRESIRKTQEKMIKGFIERENKILYEEQQAALLRRSDRFDSNRVTSSIEIRKDMLSTMKSAEIEGRMVVRLKPLPELKGDKYDILVEDMDEINVPNMPLVVTVIGSVNNPTSIPLETGKGTEYYLRKAGGLTKNADKKGIYVIRANGEAVNRFMMSKRIHRGDTVIVPQRYKYWTPPGQILRDSVEIFSRILIGVGIIAALD